MGAQKIAEDVLFVLYKQGIKSSVGISNLTELLPESSWEELNSAVIFLEKYGYVDSFISKDSINASITLDGKIYIEECKKRNTWGAKAWQVLNSKLMYVVYGIFLTVLMEFLLKSLGLK